MFGTDSLQRMGSRVARASCALLLALTALLAGPNRALASGVGALEVTQSFATSGPVPEGVDGSFAYELARTDSEAPLPPSAASDSYSFTMRGEASTSLPLRVGSGTTPDALTFSHVGTYSYELRCVTDARGVDGLSVDDATYTIRVGIENDASSSAGLVVGWVEIRDAAGRKPDALSFSHSFSGGPDVAPSPPQQETIFGIRLPKTGDALWGLMQLSAILFVAGMTMLVMGILRRRRK